MKRMLLTMALAASAFAGCQPAGSLPAAVSPSTPAASPAAQATIPPSPPTTVLPTAAPTANVSPAPTAARLTLSDARLVADTRSRFLFEAAGETRLRAVSWTDATNGVLAGEVPAKATFWPSPDGRRYVLNGNIYDADGRELGVLPWQDPSLTWSRDGQFLCTAVPETRENGAPMQLQIDFPGQQPRIVASGYGIYGNNAGYPVLACDATSDRVVVASFGQGLFAGHLWVFRLSTGTLIRSEDLGANLAGSWITASADGTLLAHSTSATMSGPMTTIVRSAESPTALQTLPDFEARGFSGDSSLLVGVTGPNSVALIEWKAARRVWSATGLQYGGYFPEPGGAHIAVGLGFVGGTEEQGDVYIVSPDGTSVILPSGVHVVPHY
jgi:hypothetical protein